MNWFKILLVCLLGLNVILLVFQAGKGKHSVEKTPFLSSLSAILELLLLFGVLFYL